MLQKIFILFLVFFFSLINTGQAIADEKGALEICNPAVDICSDPGYFCQTSKTDPKTQLCQKGLGAFDICIDTNSKCIDAGYTCLPSKTDPRTLLCQKSSISSIFGRIQPPDQLKEFLNTDPTGAGAISNFLSRLVGLFFTLALVVALFMFLWAAVEWMTSGGEKEKVASARNKIIYTIIGIVLLATAFAILNIVGIFTGFTFFAGQK